MLLSPLSTEQQQEPVWYPALPPELQFPEGYSDRAYRLGRIYEEYSKLISPEGYELFHESCYIALLSTIAKRRIKIPQGMGDYTPLMIALAAQPSAYKKTTTAKAIDAILDACGFSWMLYSGTQTPQKLILDMSGGIPRDYGDSSPDAQERTRQRLAFAGQRAVFFGELGEFVQSIGRETSINNDYMAFLLQMDDCPAIYESGTISRGDAYIVKPYLVVIGCMTPAGLIKVVAQNSKFFGIGFWSRVCVVCPPADTYLDCPFGIEDIPVPHELITALHAWHHELGIPNVSIDPVLEEDKKGEWTETGKFQAAVDPLPEQICQFGAGTYDAWVRYRSFLKHAAVKELEQRDLMANYDRLANKAMRVAALLASIENHGVMELWHWAKAQEITEHWRCGLHELYRQVNAPDHGQNLQDVLEEVLQAFSKEGKSPTVREMTQRTRKLKGIKTDLIHDVLKQLVRDGMVKPIRTERTERYKWVVE